jgi:hypothetical protein
LFRLLLLSRKKRSLPVPAGTAPRRSSRHYAFQRNKGADAQSLEEVMNKSLIALTTAIAAFAATVSQAEAGFRIGIGFGFPMGAFNHHNSYEAPRRIYRAERAPVRARKVQPKQEIAKSDDAPVAQNEDSSITVGADKVASVESSSITVASEPVKITETKKTAEIAKAIEPVKTSEPPKSKPAVAKLDCKKFFPSAGLTLTVPCE